MTSLRPIKDFRFPVMAECISPDSFKGRSKQEIEMLNLWEGNRQKHLGDLFEVEEVKPEESVAGEVIIINGDISEARRIGFGMKSGEIMINGNVGMHLGEQMRDGKIIVHGNTGSWAGSMMKGGTIEINGNAADYLGAPYRGSTEGMKGGKITVHGNVGNEAGAHMKKGLIKIYGNTGQFAGFRMCDGTIYARNNCGGRAGACMINGKIVVGGFLESVLPTFAIDSVKGKVKIEEEESVQGPFYVFLGDLAESGNGKLYVFKEKNPNLSYYEKLL